jgi:hypothetical protein
MTDWKKLGELKLHKLTVEVKTAAVIAVKRHMDGGDRPIKRSRTDAEEYVADLFRVSDRTIRHWIHQVLTDGKVKDDNRGGDHRSINFQRPDEACKVYIYITSFIAKQHKAGKGVTAQHIWFHLQQSSQYAPFFPNISVVYRYLHRHDIHYEKVDKYEALQQQEWVQRRDYYLRKILANEYVHCHFPL